MELPSDLIDLLAAFDDHKVEYLLVGGQAVALHGHPRFTKDADLWIRDETENVSRCQKALELFGAPDSVVKAIATATGLDVVWMGRPPARIDLIKQAPGGDFERAWRTQVVFDIEDVSVRVVSREELIVLKKSSGRPQDLVDVGFLLEETNA